MRISLCLRTTKRDFAGKRWPLWQERPTRSRRSTWRSFPFAGKSCRRSKRSTKRWPPMRLACMPIAKEMFWCAVAWLAGTWTKRSRKRTSWPKVSTRRDSSSTPTSSRKRGLRGAWGITSRFRLARRLRTWIATMSQRFWEFRQSTCESFRLRWAEDSGRSSTSPCSPLSRWRPGSWGGRCAWCIRGRSRLFRRRSGIPRVCGCVREPRGTAN